MGGRVWPSRPWLQADLDHCRTPLDRRAAGDCSARAFKVASAARQPPPGDRPQLAAVPRSRRLGHRQRANVPTRGTRPAGQNDPLEDAGARCPGTTRRWSGAIASFCPGPTRRRARCSASTRQRQAPLGRKRSRPRRRAAEPPKVGRQHRLCRPHAWPPTAARVRHLRQRRRGRLRLRRQAGLVAEPRHAGERLRPCRLAVVYKNLLLVQFDQGSTPTGTSWRRTLEAPGPGRGHGKTVWEQAGRCPTRWSIADRDHVAGRDQIVTAATRGSSPTIRPTAGRSWRAEVPAADVGPSPVFADGMVYVVNDHAGLAAIRADGQGDVTKTGTSSGKAKTTCPTPAAPWPPAGS